MWNHDAFHTVTGDNLFKGEFGFWAAAKKEMPRTLPKSIKMSPCQITGAQGVFNSFLDSIPTEGLLGPRYWDFDEGKGRRSKRARGRWAGNVMGHSVICCGRLQAGSCPCPPWPPSPRPAAHLERLKNDRLCWNSQKPKT